MILSQQGFLSHQQASPAHTVDVHGSSHCALPLCPTSLVKVLLLNRHFTWPVRSPWWTSKPPPVSYSTKNQTEAVVRQRNRNPPQVFNSKLTSDSPVVPPRCLVASTYTERGRDRKCGRVKRFVAFSLAW